MRLARGVILLFLLLSYAATAQDDTSPALQKQLDTIELAVIELRQLEPIDEVGLFFITREEGAAHLERRLDEDYPPEQLEALNFLYRALDLAEPDLDLGALLLEFRLSQISGFYDVESASMFIIMPGEEVPADGLAAPQKMTYGHEYVHALQDQHYDLSALSDQRRDAVNLDYRLALTALVEGDATNIMSEYLDLLLSEDRETTLSELRQANREASAIPWPAGLPRVVEAELRFAYLQGAKFVGAVQDDLGWDGVERAFREHPTLTSEQIYHPDRFLAREGAIAIDPPDHSALIDEGWRLVYDSAVGEFYLRQHLQTQLPDTVSPGLARGWGGDRLQVFADAGDNMMWVWYQVWDSAQDAEEFAVGYRSFLIHRYPGSAPDGQCRVGETAHCLGRISDIETRISMAANQEMALALLEIDS